MNTLEASANIDFFRIEAKGDHNSGNGEYVIRLDNIVVDTDEDSASYNNVHTPPWWNAPEVTQGGGLDGGYYWLGSDSMIDAATLNPMEAHSTRITARAYVRVVQ